MRCITRKPVFCVNDKVRHKPGCAGIEDEISDLGSTGIILYEPHCEKTGLWFFLTRSDTNRAVQPQKMARGLKFRM